MNGEVVCLGELGDSLLDAVIDAAVDAGEVVVACEDGAGLHLGVPESEVFDDGGVGVIGIKVEEVESLVKECEGSGA